MPQLLFKDFVNQVLLEELQELFNEGHLDNPPSPIKYRYHLFVLIAIGVEMLGAALDDYGWFQSGHSRDRFNKAIESYASLKKYEQKNLFKQWRCGMAHVYIPKNNLNISMRSEGGIHNCYNKNQDLVLHIEDVFSDFKAACSELVENIEGSKSTLQLSGKSYIGILNI